MVNITVQDDDKAFQGINRRLVSIEHSIQQVLVALESIRQAEVHSAQREEAFMADFTALNAEVANLQTVEESVVALLNGLGAQVAAALAAAGVEQSVIDAAVASINADSSAMADAVVANTPATPAP